MLISVGEVNDSDMNDDFLLWYSVKVCRLVSIKHFHQELTIVHQVYVGGSVDIGLGYA
jgi:hypothetical protein